MARAVYSHEMTDPDFEWLLTTYSERFPRGIHVNQPGMPFTIISLEGLSTPTPLQAILAASAAKMSSQLNSPRGDKESP
jgi:hypothetical protein